MIVTFSSVAWPAVMKNPSPFSALLPAIVLRVSVSIFWLKTPPPKPLPLPAVLPAVFPAIVLWSIVIGPSLKMPPPFRSVPDTLLPVTRTRVSVAMAGLAAAFSIPPPKPALFPLTVTSVSVRSPWL